MRRLRLLWLLVPALGLVELGLHVVFAHRAPSVEAWRALAGPALALKHAGEPVVVAPEWAEPLARWALGDRLFPLGELAKRHPDVPFILAHIGGGGDWTHTLDVTADQENIFIDLSGSGVDGGMLEACLAAVGSGRMLWGCDLTMDTGWAKLRYLERIASASDFDRIRWRNAASIFPAGAFQQ